MTTVPRSAATTMTRPVVSADHRDDTEADGDARLPRFFGLGLGLPVVVLAALAARHRSFWLDEAYTMAATRDLGSTFAAGRGSMGLYYAFAWAWGQASSSTMWMRLPSFLAMGAAVAVVARLTARHHGVFVGRMVGIASGASFATLRYAQEARSYGLVCLFVALAWSALDRSLDGTDAAPRAVRLHRLCCVVLPLLHGLAAIQLVAQLGVVVVGLPAEDRRRAAVGPLLGLGVLGCLVVAGAGEAGSWMAPLDLTGVRRLVEALSVPVAGLSLLVVAVVGVHAARLLRRAAATPAGVDRLRLLVPVAWGPGAILGILALSTLRPSHLPRYTIAAVFGVVLLVVLAGADYDRSRGGPGNLPLATIVATVVLALGGLLALQPGPDDWPQTVEVVADGARPGDAIVFPTEDARLPFEVAWLQARPAATPDLVGSSRPLGTVERSLATPTADELAADLDDAARVWVVVQPYAQIPNPDLVGHPDVAAAYRTEQVWTAGDITVTLLVHR